MILNYRDPEDQESVQLAQLLAEKPLREVIQTVTKLEDGALIDEIEAAYTKNK